MKQSLGGKVGGPRRPSAARLVAGVTVAARIARINISRARIQIRVQLFRGGKYKTALRCFEIYHSFIYGGLKLLASLIAIPRDQNLVGHRHWRAGIILVFHAGNDSCCLIALGLLSREGRNRRKLILTGGSGRILSVRSR